jgi:hypothetical protein
MWRFSDRAGNARLVWRIWRFRLNLKFDLCKWSQNSQCENFHPVTLERRNACRFSSKVPVLVIFQFCKNWNISTNFSKNFQYKKIAAFCVVAPCCLIEIYRRFRDICCRHLEGLLVALMMEAASSQAHLKSRWFSTWQHGVTTQKAATFMLAAVRI